MMAAIIAARGKHQVTILEKNNRLGRKLLATGNGRCNFTNALCGPRGFYAEEDGFIAQALEKFGPMDAIDFFRQIGILEREETQGRVYPYSEQAATIADGLAAEVYRLGIQVVLNVQVTRVTKEKNFCAFGTVLDEIQQKGTVLNERKQTWNADRLVIAAGGLAGQQYGATDVGYKIAVGLGHTVKKPLPALVQLTSKNPSLKTIKGVRAKATVSLFIENQLVMDEEGEVQFTEFGVSGICVFNVSRMAVSAIEANKKCRLEVDLFPGYEDETLKGFLEHQLDQGKTMTAILENMTNKKLAQIIASKTQSIDGIIEYLKNFRFDIDGCKGWRDAQVTTGGVTLAEVNSQTMESKLVSGLYFCGEVLDVDGICGGYNLQWAWTSGYLAGSN